MKYKKEINLQIPGELIKTFIKELIHQKNFLEWQLTYAHKNIDKKTFDEIAGEYLKENTLYSDLEDMIDKFVVEGDE